MYNKYIPVALRCSLVSARFISIVLDTNASDITASKAAMMKRIWLLFVMTTRIPLSPLSLYRSLANNIMYTCISFYISCSIITTRCFYEYYAYSQTESLSLLYNILHKILCLDRFVLSFCVLTPKSCKSCTLKAIFIWRFLSLHTGSSIFHQVISVSV